MWNTNTMEDNVSCPHIIHTSVAYAIGPNGTMSLTDFSFENLAFWNLFEFWVVKIFLKSISRTL